MSSKHSKHQSEVCQTAALSLSYNGVRVAAGRALATGRAHRGDEGLEGLLHLLRAAGVHRQRRRRLRAQARRRVPARWRQRGICAGHAWDMRMTCAWGICGAFVGHLCDTQAREKGEKRSSKRSRKPTVEGGGGLDDNVG